MEIDKKFVGWRIALIRDKHNKTLEEFGKLIDGATKSNVSKWEKGEVLPNRKRLKMIADYDGITVNELLYANFQDFCLYVFLDVQNDFFKKFIDEDGYYNADGAVFLSSYDEQKALTEFNESTKQGNFNTMDYKILSRLAETAIKNNFGKVSSFKTVNDLLDELSNKIEGSETLVYSTFFNPINVDGQPTIVLKEGFDIREYNEIVTVLHKCRDELENLKKPQ